MRKYKDRFYRILFWLYAAVLFRLTVFRVGCFTPPFCAGEVVLIPFVYLRQLLDAGYVAYFCYLFLGNIIWFVPLGVYLGYRRISFLPAAVYGCLTSALIEAGQFLLSSGVSEVEDVILNTFGAVLGWCFFWIVKHFKGKQ